MLEDTLKWRSTYKPEDIRWDEIVVEGETGKLYRASVHDREGRIVLVLRPGMQWLLLNTSSKENQMRHLVYMLENAMLNLPHGQEQMSWLIDFTEWSFRNSNHYPERLAIAFLYNPPRVFEAFWKRHVLYTTILIPFKYYDVTYEENLPIKFGGKGILNYNHEEFSILMAQATLVRVFLEQS
ncbi:hypothetical protein GLYMA_04G032500v4 [Glycine max]|uniref:CRAL-TRIO domain-containing protein n=1 Tax=Glycine max TaxID=3847 RepID=I1JTB7_SOYBN|nr:hypothetical protein GYH30_008789 [Glycine max]KRH61179.1 hypothetical protein GLYMA_04G032500v4 [Glycine max]